MFWGLRCGHLWWRRHYFTYHRIIENKWKKFKKAKTNMFKYIFVFNEKVLFYLVCLLRLVWKIESCILIYEVSVKIFSIYSKAIILTSTLIFLYFSKVIDTKESSYKELYYFNSYQLFICSYSFLKFIPESRKFKDTE